ncbi:hypothetical protein CFP56_023329 [Quercus suber]
MRVDDSKSRPQILLQLRVRALLFDKASVSLFLRSNPSSSSSLSVSKLNPTYLQLHGDDVYFTLESAAQDVGVSSNTASSKVSSLVRSPNFNCIAKLNLLINIMDSTVQIQSRAGFSVGSRYGESEIDNVSQRFRNEELSETWYNQFIEKYRVSKPYRLSSGDHESDKPEHVKDGSKNLVQQTQQLQGIQSQLQSLQHNSLRIAQQMPRQIHPQMQPIVHPQNLTFQQQPQQQQLDRIRRRQPSTPRPVMDVEKDRPMVQVKIENPSELPMDGNSFNTINARHHPQMQLRAQQIAAMSNLHPQTGTQFRQMTSLQIPQVQTQSMGIVRAPPVKVEGFQELMGGDATSKHDADENRLMSPSSK